MNALVCGAVDGDDMVLPKNFWVACGASFLLLCVLAFNWSSTAEKTLEQLLDSSGKISILTMYERAAPALSSTGQGRIYYDTTADVFKVSTNGGAYSTLSVGGLTGLANPTGTVGTTAVNGTATTAMRSDGAPPLGNLTGGITSVGLVTTIKRSCQPGLGDGLNAIAAGTYPIMGCYNGFGSTWTITALKCFSDNNGTTTLDVKNGAGVSLLTGVITCSNTFAAGTQSATTTIVTTDYIKVTIVGDGTSKNVHAVIDGTF